VLNSLYKKYISKHFKSFW